MSIGHSGRKAGPEIRDAMKALVDRHTAYYEGWLQSQSSRPTQPQDDGLRPINTGDVSPDHSVEPHPNRNHPD